MAVRQHPAWYVCLILSAGGLSSLCRADAVYTSDGSKLVGTIDQMTDTKLVIVTNVAGRLEIEMDNVVAVESDHVVNIEFESGDRLVGTLKYDAAAGTSRVETAFGPVPVDASTITALWPQGKDSPEVVAVRKKLEAEAERLRPKWSLSLEGGITRREGNTDTLDGRGRFDLRRKTNKDLLHFFLAGSYSEQDDVRSTNEYYGGIAYENSITDRWYWYARTRMEFDEFEDLDLRAEAAFGGGYYWIKTDPHELKTRAGLGYRHESFDDGESRDAAIIDLGLDYRLDINEYAQFTHSLTYSPDFEEFDDYRLDADTAMVFPLKKDIWKLKLGVRNEYNSRPQRGLERLDNTYYANILLELKDG